MEQKASKIKHILMITLIVSILLLGIFIIRGYLAGHFHSVETLQAYISSFGIFAPVILIVVQIIQVILPVLPGLVGCVVGVGMFGAIGSFWCNYIGISAGSIIAFLLARRFGVELVKLMVPADKYQACVDWLETKKCFTVVLFLSILLPLAPDDLLCYLSGLTKMPLRRFTWIILLGKPWCILAYCIFFGYFI